MRLIDANKLIAHLSDFALAVAPVIKDESWEYNLSRYGYKTIQECIRGVEEQPTVKAIPVDWLLSLRAKYLEAGCPMSACVVNEIHNLWKYEEKEND